MSEHSYAVTPVVEQAPSTFAAVMRYRAECDCGEPFPLRDKRDEAGLDGLDHIRSMAGRKTRREEIDDEKLARLAARQTPVSPIRHK